jgi:alpha-L-fucosidase 2
LYNGDQKFLAKVYPVMKGAATFFLDTLVEDPNTNYLVTCPSLSPEHEHGHGRTSVCAGPSMDMQILRDLFTNCIQAAKILGVDSDFCNRISAARAKLSPIKIGSEGQLQEWQADWDMQAPDISHRHLSHLYGLFPSNQITVRGTPELAAAVKKSLEIRSDDATGWGLAWRMELWDHLFDGDHAYRILKLLITPQRTYPNMFDSCPPFQIDGNFGGTSGIAEMLLQSSAEEIDVLPSLPTALQTGSVTGLRTRGGFEVDLKWQNGELSCARIRSLLGRPSKICCHGFSRDLDLEKGQQIVLNNKLEQQ